MLVVEFVNTRRKVHLKTYFTVCLQTNFKIRFQTHFKAVLKFILKFV